LPKGTKYGEFGGQFVPEVLMPAFRELELAYAKYKNDAKFNSELADLLKNFVGRPTPLYHAKKLSEKYGCDIYLKREDLAHTGAHKINNTVGQVLLAKYMGKKRVIAETGAGQHGVATAAACAMVGLECAVYMGSVDVERQALNVARMKLLGAKVIPVETGQKTLKDAINAALRDWIANVENTYYCLGSVMCAHPYPMLVRDFQSVIGKEVKEQMNALGKKPDALVACVGGGSNAMGLFYAFVDDKETALIGVEAGGKGIDVPGGHSATLTKGEKGVLHGMLSYLLQNKDGQVSEVHSVSAGLDYPGVGPEHSYLRDSKRAEYAAIGDAEALKAFEELSKVEGILPALESSHALAYIPKIAKRFKGKNIVVCLSGRGDKDLGIVLEHIKLVD